MSNVNTSEKFVVGLDIGTTKICVVVGRKNQYGKLEIFGMGQEVSDGVIRGMVLNIDKTINSIKKALKMAEEEADIHIWEVVVGIAGEHIKSDTKRGSMMLSRPNSIITREDLKLLEADMYKLITPPGNEIIHVMPQEYIVDFNQRTLDPVGMKGNKLEADFHIITADTYAVSNINQCVMQAKGGSNKREMLQIKNLILEPLASSLSVLSKEEKEAGVAIVDIGGGTTDLAIFHDGVIRHTAVLPYGGNIITQDIKEELKVMLSVAEAL